MKIKRPAVPSGVLSRVILSRVWLATALVVACNSSGSTTSPDGGQGGVQGNGGTNGSGGALGGGGSGDGGYAGSASAGGRGGNGGGLSGGSGNAAGGNAAGGGGAAGDGGGSVASGGVGGGEAGGRAGAGGGAAAAGGHGGVAGALLVTYAFTARIRSIVKDPRELPEAPVVGDLVTGTITYDPDPSHYAVGVTQYEQKWPGSGLFVQSGSWSFVPQSTFILSSLGTGAGGTSGAGSFMASSSTETWVEKNMSNCFASFQVGDPSATLFHGLSLPPTVDVTKLTQDQIGGLIFKTFGVPHFEINATIDTFAKRD